MARAAVALATSLETRPCRKLARSGPPTVIRARSRAMTNMGSAFESVGPGPLHMACRRDFVQPLKSRAKDRPAACQGGMKCRHCRAMAAADLQTLNFWNFSLKVYGRPGVAAACIALQDGLGLDVNLLLYCCWHGRARRRLEAADL